MENYKTELNLKDTELRLGLPGTDELAPEKRSVVRSSNKRSSPEASEVESINKSNVNNSNGSDATSDDQDNVPPAK